jgi:hypothetical protein
MKKRALLILIVCSFLVHSVAKAQVYDTIARKQTLLVDIGFGGIPLMGDGIYKSETGTNLTSYQSGLSFQTSVGYALKLDRMCLEWKLGYNHASYAIEETPYSRSRGPTTRTTQKGSASINTGFLQLLGVTFGKERSWGSLCIGANLRYNFIVDTHKNGSAITEGTRWEDNIYVQVYEENPFTPPLFYSNFTIGLQTGANFKLSPESEIQARIEFNFNGNEMKGYSAFQGLICIGYVLVLKRDRVVMRRN